MFTVMIGIASDVDEIGAHWAKFKSGLRNKVNSLRQSRPSWDHLALSGWLEADPITFDDFALIGSEQKMMLASLNSPCWRSDGGPAWVVHIHGVAIHREVHPVELQTSLAARWRGDRRVHVEPFHQDRSVEENVRAVVRYSTKFRPGRWVSGSLDLWPPTWLSEYYSWADYYSRGWQSLRVRINFKNSRKHIAALSPDAVSHIITS